MKKTIGKWLVRCGAAVCCLGGMALPAATVEEMAGVWEVWRLEDGRRTERNGMLYRLNADGSWDFVFPGMAEPAGEFRVAGDELTLSLTGKNGETVEDMPVKVMNADLMWAQNNGITVEFLRFPDNRAQLEKNLPGEWNLFYVTEDMKVERAPFYLVFAADGSWREVIADQDAAKDFEPGSGTYVIDQVGFLMLSDANGGELVFSCLDGRLTGWGDMDAMFCTKR